MNTQRLLGRAQARQGRTIRKAKRGRFDVHSRKRQTFVEEGLGIKVRAAIGDDTLRCSDGLIRVRSDDEVVQSAKTGEFETAYFGPRTYLQVRLKTDTKGQFRAARERLLELACEMDFGCRSANGPTCYEDAGRVWIKLKVDPVDACPLARELRAGGWKQYHTDGRVFCKKSTVLRQTWAVAFCERHSGEWWTLSKVSREAVDLLYRSVEWCELFERTRSLPSTGTAEHAREFHKWRKPTSRNKLSDGYNGINREVRGGRAEDGIGYEMVKEPCPLPKMRHAGINYNKEQVGEIMPDGSRVIYRPSRRQFGYSFGETGTKLPFGS